MFDFGHQEVLLSKIRNCCYLPYQPFGLILCYIDTISRHVKFPIYLDNNATTPCDPRVLDAMIPYYSTHFGNAASHNHLYGWEAAEAVELAREQGANLVGAERSEEHTSELQS